MNETKAIKILTDLCNSTDAPIMLESKGYGLISADTLACILLDNIEAEKNNPISHLDCFLPYESKAVQQFFTSLGFTF